MNIAVVGPSPVPFSIGGMENLQNGLMKSINEYTTHNCELIKIPSKESSFWDLINTYKSFYRLDLSHFDLVISIKYPAWMVQHRNHICYMAHRLRGFYDTYHFLNMPEDFKSNSVYIKELLDYINLNRNLENLDEFFDLISDIFLHKDALPKEYFNFPHPFVRKLVRYMDDFALSPNRIKKYFAIANTVRNRKDYFPVGADVEVVYPPSTLIGLKPGDFDYLFTVSRLDSPKRINLLIEAMKYVKRDIKLKIAGKGPEENHLRMLSKDDSRIEFLGFKGDNELVELYSNALGILFIPYDEDYGLVTIEAMKSRKPVITCNDSGGTNEFVINDATGLIAKPEPKSLAEKIEKLINNVELARKLGDEAYNKVKNISWESTVQKLLGDKCIQISPLPKKKKKITVTSHFSVFPPRGGGQSRIFNLYRHMTQYFDIEIVSLAHNNECESRKEISKGLFETVIPKTAVQAEKEWEYEKEVGVPVSDSVLPLVSYLTPKYGHALMKAINDSDIVIASHPYLLYEIEKYRGNRRLIYEAQDIEYNLKKNIYKDNKTSNKILNTIFKIEQETCKKSNLIMTCSEEDRVALSKLYDTSLGKFIVVPNGVDCDEIEFTSFAQRQQYKKDLGFEEEYIAIFIGSWHPPNIEAVKCILKIAIELSHIKFLIIGSVCMAIKDIKLPDNVGLMGVVTDQEKKLVYEIADVALNPMVSGSGTNIKMFDYMAAGIPVISTEFGARGIKNEMGLFISEAEQFPSEITKIFNNQVSYEILQRSRDYVEKEFNWCNIVNNLYRHLQNI